MKNEAVSVFEKLQQAKDFDFNKIQYILTYKEKSFINILKLFKTAMNTKQIVNRYIDLCLSVALEIVDSDIKNPQEMADKILDKKIKLERYPIELRYSRKEFKNQVRAIAQKYPVQNQKHYDELSKALSSRGFEIPSFNTVKGILENLSDMGIVILRESKEGVGKAKWLWILNPKFVIEMEKHQIDFF